MTRTAATKQLWTRHLQKRGRQANSNHLNAPLIVARSSTSHSKQHQQHHQHNHTHSAVYRIRTLFTFHSIVVAYYRILSLGCAFNRLHLRLHPLPCLHQLSCIVAMSAAMSSSAFSTTSSPAPFPPSLTLNRLPPGLLPSPDRFSSV